jgi:TonB family protein
MQSKKCVEMSKELCTHFNSGRREVRTTLTTLVLVFAMLGLVCSEPSAFSQETNQAEPARKIKARVDPRYPALARQLNLAGKVKIEVTISPDGRVKSTRVLGGSPVLVGAALDAIRMWKYVPGPKETVDVIELDFKDPQK